MISDEECMAVLESEFLQVFADQIEYRRNPVPLRKVEDNLLEIVKDEDEVENVLNHLIEDGYIERGELIMDYAGVKSKEECIVLTRDGAHFSGKFPEGLIRGKYVQRWTCIECGKSVWLGEVEHEYVLCDCCEGMPYMKRKIYKPDDFREI